MNRSYKELSRVDVTISSETEKNIWNVKDVQPVLQSGALMRIADAIEKQGTQQDRIFNQQFHLVGQSGKEIKEVLKELNTIQQRYERKISSLNAKIFVMNKRITQLENK